MQLRAEQLEAHLAKSLASCYTIFGDEPLLVLEAADAVRAAARRHGYSERQVLVAGAGFDWSELLQAGANRSLFGGSKVIELRIPGGKPGAAGAAAIARCCARPSAENLLLVTLPRPDGAFWKSPWFVALSEAGVALEVQPIGRARLPDWIGARLARNGQRASPEALEYLADRVEGNLLAAHQEVQKLALLAPRGELDSGAVREAVSDVARFDPYVASDALLAADARRYVRAIEGLRGEGEAPVYVLTILAGDLQALARVEQLVAGGRSVESALETARVRKRRQPAIRAALRRFGRDALRAALARAARIDRVAKGVARGDPWDEFIGLGLELTHGTEGARRIA